MSFKDPCFFTPAASMLSSTREASPAPCRASHVLLAASQNAIKFKKQGFKLACR